MLQARPGRSGKQQQLNSPNLETAFQPIPAQLILYMTDARKAIGPRVSVYSDFTLHLDD